MDISNLHQQARSLYQAGQIAPARQLYQQALAQKPDSPDIYLEFSNLLMQQGDLDAAAHTLKTGLTHLPESDGILAALGMLTANRGEPALGLELAERALQLQPDSIPGHCTLAYIQQQLGETENAIQSAHHAVELAPDNPESRALLASLFKENKQPDEAIRVFEETVQRVPQWLPAYYHLGTLLEEEHRFEEAVRYYQKAQKMAPANSEMEKKVGLLLHSIERIDEAEQCFRQALKLAPNDTDAHVLLANTLRDQDRMDEAADAYRAALKLTPDHQIASENLQRINQTKVLQWHFDMLADTARNDAYDQALTKAAAGKTQVLDIGTGSGLLAMMAARAGAKRVTTCEMVPTLAQIAQQIVKDNNLQNRITVLNKKSSGLVIGEDMPEKADLVVSEILDTGLLGEGVLPTLRHAWANLLKPDAVVIPRAATIEGVLIQTDHLQQTNPIREISGFDLSAFNQFRMDGKLMSRELEHTPHQKLTDIFPIQAFDFRNLPPLTTEASPNVETLEVQITGTGEVHGIAFWFDINMDDELTVSTAPEGEMKHWKQAIVLFPEPMQVTEGDTVNLVRRQFETRLEFQLQA